MKLKDVDLIKLCPAFMRNDKSNIILANGVNNIFQTCLVVKILNPTPHPCPYGSGFLSDVTAVLYL